MNAKNTTNREASPSAKRMGIYHGLLPEYHDSEILPTPAMWTRALTRHTVSATSAFRKSIWRSPLGMRVIWFTSPKDSHHFRTASRRAWSPFAMPLTTSFFFRFSREIGSAVETWRKPFPADLNENGSRRVPGLIETEFSAFGGSWRCEASGGKDHKE